jgi:hypothetical protein
MSDRTCDICGGPVPPRRRKYCGDECYEISASKRGRAYVQAVRRGERVRRPQGPRGCYQDRTKAKQKRVCLRCGAEFDSAGPGNRICSACQVRNAAWLRETPETYKYIAALWD